MTRIPVLDHGYVELIDHMGSDAAICRAARVSNDRHGDPVDAKRDRGLIRRLMWDRHTSPFEMGELVFQLKLPIFVARQWVRHRTASLNEVSGRYVELDDVDFYVPDRESICQQSTTNKQGRGASLRGSAAEDVRADIGSAYRLAASHYDGARRHYDLAREIARIVLPLGTYTEMVWKIDLHNLLHFLALRLADDAQDETRAYAQALHDLAAPCFPATFRAWQQRRQVGAEFAAAMKERWREMSEEWEREEDAL